MWENFTKSTIIFELVITWSLLTSKVRERIKRENFSENFQFLKGRVYFVIFSIKYQLLASVAFFSFTRGKKIPLYPPSYILLIKRITREGQPVAGFRLPWKDFYIQTDAINEVRRWECYDTRGKVGLSIHPCILSRLSTWLNRFSFSRPRYINVVELYVLENLGHTEINQGNTMKAEYWIEEFNERSFHFNSACISTGIRQFRLRKYHWSCAIVLTRIRDEIAEFKC